MLKQIWNSDSEKLPMLEWHEILLRSQGQILLKAEKLDNVRKKLYEANAKESRGIQLATEYIANKLDTLPKKAKRLYGKGREILPQIKS